MKTIFYLDISLCLQRITTSAHQDNFKAKIGVMFTGTKVLARFFISGFFSKENFGAKNWLFYKITQIGERTNWSFQRHPFKGLLYKN